MTAADSVFFCFSLRQGTWVVMEEVRPHLENIARRSCYLFCQKRCDGRRLGGKQGRMRMGEGRRGRRKGRRRRKRKRRKKRKKEKDRGREEGKKKKKKKKKKMTRLRIMLTSTPP